MSFILLNRTYYLKWPNKPLSLPMLQSTHFWINIIFLMTLPFLNNFSCVCIKFYGLLDLFVPFESLTKPWNTNYFAKESEIWHLHTFCISGYKLIIFFSLYSYSKLLKIAAKVPLPLSVAMLAFGRMHLYRVPHFVTFSLLLHVLCCFV